MNLWQKVAVLGVKDDMSISKQKSTIFFNIVMRIALLVMSSVAIAMFLFLDFKFVPIGIFASLPLIGLSLILNYKGKVELSVFITSLLFPLYFLGLSIFAKLNGEGLTLINAIIPRFGIMIMASISFAVLGFDSPQKAFTGAGFGLLILIFFHPIHQIFGITIMELELKASDVTTLIIGLTGLFVFILMLTSIMQKINKEYEIIVTKQRDELLQKNSEINEQKEEILSQNAEIEAQKNYLIEKNQKIEQQNSQITASILYASNIQAAILPKLNDLQQNFDSFIFFKPRDIVSGDFYWFRKIENKLFVAAADCTGHGVPGAFVSMLGVSFLNSIILEKSISETDDILNHLRDMIKYSLHQKGEIGEQKDGMDIAIYSLDLQDNNLSFSGAQNPLYLIRDKFDEGLIEQIKSDKQKRFLSNDNYSLLELKPDKMPIGVHVVEKPFSKQHFSLQKNDLVYIFSDGFIDQFGGEKNEKFMSGRFKKFLLTIADKKIAEQHVLINQQLESWMNNVAQLDDILIIGVKI